MAGAGDDALNRCEKQTACHARRVRELPGARVALRCA